MLSIRRPNRIIVRAFEVGHAPDIAAIGTHHENISAISTAGGGKSQQSAIERPIGLTVVTFIFSQAAFLPSYAVYHKYLAPTGAIGKIGDLPRIRRPGGRTTFTNIATGD